MIHYYRNTTVKIMRIYQYFQDSWSDMLMYLIHITMRQIKKEKIKRVPIVTADFSLRNVLNPKKKVDSAS